MGKKPNKKGPKPERLIIDDDNWENAMKKALQKERPKDGWPDENKKSSK